MHHVILGPGAIGGLMGACLAHSGERVTLVVRPATLATYPDRLHLESTFGTFDEAIEPATSAPSADVLWIAVKAPQLEEALRAVPDSSSLRAVVPLLNGIDHVQRLRLRFGEDLVIPATIAGESERVAPGRIVHPAPVTRLNVSSRGRKVLTGTLDLLQRIGFACQFLDDETTLLWSKLAFLAPLALTASAAGVPVGEIVSNDQRRAQLEASTKEACAVALAEGAKVDFTATFNSMLKLPGSTRPSMLKDLEQGRTPEVDAVAGPILRSAARHQIPVPVMQSLASAVERKAQKAA